MSVLAVNAWPTNGHLIADVARLGYIRKTDRVIDLTPGEHRVWWKQWRPTALELFQGDFRSIDLPSDHFDVVAFDPPYKLNGTPDPKTDARYGVDKATPWRKRHVLVLQGIREGLRITKPGGFLLVKCMDQVCSGKIRWQTRDFACFAALCGGVLVDRFDMIGQHRKQPMEGRTQRHAHGRPSTLLIFRKS